MAGWYLMPHNYHLVLYFWWRLPWNIDLLLQMWPVATLSQIQKDESVSNVIIMLSMAWSVVVKAERWFVACKHCTRSKIRRWDFVWKKWNSLRMIHWIWFLKLIWRSRIHAQKVMIVKIIKMRAIANSFVKNPSGGRRGSSLTA